MNDIPLRNMLPFLFRKKLKYATCKITSNLIALEELLTKKVLKMFYLVSRRKKYSNIYSVKSLKNDDVKGI